MRKYLVWQVLFIAVYGFLSLVPIGVGAWLATVGFGRVMYRTISGNLRQTAADKAARINQWFHERTLDVRGISSSASVREAVANPASRREAGQFLDFIERHYGYYRELCIALPDGRCLVGSGTTETSQRTCRFAVQAARDRVDISDLRVAPPDTEPSMYVSGPIADDAGQTIAFVIGRIALDQLDSIAKDIHLGRTAEAYLVNEQGYFVTGSRFEANVRLRLRISSEGFRKCLARGAGVGLYRDYRGEPVLGSYVRIPERGWCLLVEQDRAEALQPLRMLRHWLAVFALVAGAIVLVFVVLSSRLIVQRIRRGDEQLEQKRRELTRAEKLASTGRMAAGIAHEINNPVNSIMNCASLMTNRIRKGEYDSEYFLRFLTAIEREGRRTARIVRDFLDFSRETEPHFAPTDINAALEETLVLLEPEAGQQKVKIERGFDRNLPVIPADRAHLVQAFRNIILNALQAMPQGGLLTIETRRRGRRVEVYFNDTGAGIEPADLDRVFDPFFSRRAGGSGLGLSVVYGIIDRHNGSIAVESELGHGTRFSIRLPLTQPEAGARTNR